MIKYIVAPKNTLLSLSPPFLFLSPSFSLSFPFLFCRLSASCTHISAVLHALVAMTPTEFLQQPSASTSGDDNESLPCTSYPCQWKQPKKRKESNLRMGDAVFEKHVLGRECKRKVVAIEDFDPRPQKYRGTVKERVPVLLDKIRGEGLCISLLLDPKVRHWDNSLTATPSISIPSLPKPSSLADTMQHSRTASNCRKRNLEKLSSIPGSKGSLINGLKSAVTVLRHHCLVTF